MKTAIRVVWRTILCAVTIIACDIEGLDDLLPHEDAGIDVDADSQTDVDSDSDANTDSDTDEANGLNGVYFNDIRLTDKAFEREDSTINFDWGEGSPGSGVDRDSFSVRWTGSIMPRYTETYTLTTESDDGVRLWIDGKSLVSNWTHHSLEENEGTIELKAEKLYAIKLEYYDNAKYAAIKLYWSSASQSKEIIPASALFKTYDECPNDPDKTLEGECGCGEEEGTCETKEFKFVLLGIDRGDSALYIFPTGKTMLIDTGTTSSFTETVRPFLERHGIKHFDYYMETHPHGDHTSGRPLLEKGGYIDGTTKRWDYKTFKYGDTFELEGTQWFIYNSFDQSFHGGGANANSFSFRIEYNGFVMTGSGDGGSKSKERFLKEHPDLVPAHVRNVNHHCNGPCPLDFVMTTDAVVYFCSDNHTVTNNWCYNNVYVPAAKELEASSTAKFEALVVGGRDGHVAVRVSSATKWSYEIIENRNTCVLSYIP